MNIKPLLKSIAKINETRNREEKETGIGELLKKKRLSLKLTLKEVAKDTCSISYLSKIERNEIKPNQEFLMCLMENINVSKNEIYLLENARDLLIESIDYLYNYDYGSFECLYDDIRNIDNNTNADIIIFGYYASIGQLNMANNYASRLIDIATSLDETQVTVFSIFLSHYLLKTGSYPESYQIISQLKNYNSIAHFEPIVNDLLFNVSVLSGRCTIASYYYLLLNRYYAVHPNIRRIIELKYTYAKLLYFEGEYEHAIRVLTNTSEVQDIAIDERFLLILGLSYFRLDKKIKAKEYLDKILINSPYFRYCIQEKYMLEEDGLSYLQEVYNAYSYSSDPFIRYFILSKTDRLSKSFFNSMEYVALYDDSSYYEKVELLKNEREYLLSKCQYKQVYLITKKIEDLKDRMHMESLI